jgi:hypothetical protein
MNARYVTALLAVLLAWPAAGLAQTDIHLRVTPRLGAFTPAGWFYEEFAPIGGPGADLEWTDAAFMKSTAAGLTAELEFGDSGLWIRAEVLRTVAGETRLGHKVLIESDGVSQPYVQSVYFWIPSAMTLGTLDLALPTRFTLPFGIQPYISAGIGGKRYDFDLTTEVLEYPDRALERPAEGVVWVTNVGGGVVVDVYGMRLDLAARDAISEYWGEQQHDVFWLVGLTWTLF